MEGEGKTKRQFTGEIKTLRRPSAKLQHGRKRRKKVEKTLRLAQFSIDHAKDAIFWIRSDAGFFYVNNAACRLYGYSYQELLSMTVHDIAQDFPREAWPYRWQELKRRGSVIIETRHRARDGRLFPVEITDTFLTFKGQEYSFAFVRDITERKRLEAQLGHMANRDSLTGLLNRRRFQEELERELARARRYNTPGALLFLDLDQFKYVNDGLGHQAGDELLKGLATLLREGLREIDILARLGGDEFAILLPRTDATQTQLVARRIMNTVRRYTGMAGGQPVRITASIGIALFPEHGYTAGELLAHADLAMYQAKEDGRDLFRVYRPDRGLTRAVRIQAGLGLTHPGSIGARSFSSPLSAHPVPSQQAHLPI